MLLETDVPGGQIALSACYKLTDTQVDRVYCYIYFTCIIADFFLFFLLFFVCSKNQMNIGIV